MNLFRKIFSAPNGFVSSPTTLAGILLFIVYCSLITAVWAQNSPDAIAFRVIANPRHYSPLRWYDETVTAKGSPQELLVDGYRAVRDGRTVYVGAANYDAAARRLYTNIYIISYNQQAERATEDIFGQILAHWRFNTNLETEGNCIASTTMVCINDRECPSNDYCTSLKAEVVRNTRRLSDLADVDLALADYKKKNGRYPIVGSGSYLKHKTLSTWPSWQETFGRELSIRPPVDPVNRLGACPGFDPKTCWDAANSAFAGTLPDNLSAPVVLPVGSQVYSYRVSADGLSYKLSISSVDPLTIIGGGAELTGILANQPPKIVEPPNSRVVESGITYINTVSKRDAKFEYFVRATDPDSDLGPIGLWTFTPLNPSAWTAAGWAALPALSATANPEIKKLSAPAVGRGGKYYFSLTVNDGSGGSDTRQFVVTVENLPPIVTVDPAAAAVIVGKNDLVRRPITITAVDPERNYPVTYTMGGTLPTGLAWSAVDATTTYQISGIPIFAPATATTTFSFVFTDSYGASSPGILTITVINHPPRFTSAPVTTVRAGGNYRYQSRATDADGHTVRYSGSLLPAGLMIDRDSGIVSGSSTSGVFPVAIEAFDGYGATTSQNYDLTVNNYCGDGLRQAVNMEGVNEVCDGRDNIAASPAASMSTLQYACSTACQYNGGYCGDGRVQTIYGETCDDGNRNNLDGCNSSCQVEDHWSCSGAPSVCLPDTRTVACSPSLPIDAVWNTSPTVLQTWSGTDWQPPNSSSYSTTTPGICRYSCPSGYAWDGVYCEKLCPAGTTKVTRHGVLYCQSGAYVWTHQLDHTAVINFHDDGTITYTRESLHGALSTIPGYAYPFSYDPTIMFPAVAGTEYDLGVTGSSCYLWYPAATTTNMISIPILEPSAGEHVCTANIQKYIPLY